MIPHTLRFNPSEYHSAARLFLQYFAISFLPRDFSRLPLVLDAFSQIPYENLSKIIKFNQNGGEWDRLRSPDEVWWDYRNHHLGGTCYSLTFFLWSILDYVGFDVAPLTMDMKWGAAVHCGLLLKNCEENWLIDPGYLFDQPLLLNPQSTSSVYSNHTCVEIERSPTNDGYELFTRDQNQRKFRYRFRSVPITLEQFLLAWKGSFHEKSMRHLCLTRIDNRNRGRIYIRNNYIRLTTQKGIDKIQLPAAEAVRQFFQIDSNYFELARSLLIGANQTGHAS